MTPDLMNANAQAFVGLLSADELREFQQLVQDACDVWLDEDEAAARASQLLYLVVALIGMPSGPAVRTSSGLDENPKTILE